MKPIQMTAQFKIKHGNIDAFKKLAQSCINTVKEKDPGTLQYDWFFNSDETVCHVRETYANSDAVLAHAGNVGPFLGDLMAITEFSGRIYGEVTDQLKNALSVFDVEYYSFYEGL